MLNYQKGSVTMIAIVTMMFLTILASATSTIVNNDLRFSKIGSDAIEAQFAAEAGAKRAISMFNQTTQVWTWLDINSTPIWQLLSTDTNKRYHVQMKDSNGNIIVPSSPANSGTYTIISTGSVNGTTRSVSVPITVTAATTGVISKYAVYSNGDLDLYGGSSPAPYLNLDIGTNGSYIKIDMGNNTLLGKIYTTHGVSYSYYPKGAKDSKGNPTWYSVESAGSLTVNIPQMPQMPTVSLTNSTQYQLPGTGGQYWNGATITPPATVPTPYDKISYVYNGSYFLEGTSIFDSTNKPPTIIYVNGNFKMDTNTVIKGDDVTLVVNGNVDVVNNSSINVQKLKIYATGNFKMDSNTVIKGDDITLFVNGNFDMANTNSNTSITAKNLKVYAMGNIHLTNNSSIVGDNVILQTTSTSNGRSSSAAFCMDNTSSINKNTTGIVYIYANSRQNIVGGSINLTNQAIIGGSAALVVANSYVYLDNSVKATNGIFVANGTNSQSYITGTIDIAGIFVNGLLKIDGSPSVNRNNQKDSVLQILSLTLQSVIGGSSGSGSGSSTISIGTWGKS